MKNDSPLFSGETSEGLYRLLFEENRDAVIIRDRAGMFLDCNPAALRLFKCPLKSDLSSTYPTDYSPKKQVDGRDSVAAAGEYIDQVFREGTCSFEWLSKKRDGTIFSSEILLSRLEIEGKAVFQSVVRDISERKRVDAKLRESEERYHQLIHALPAAVYTCDTQGRIDLYNAAAVSLWGRKPNSGDRWCGSYRLFTPDGKRLTHAQSPMADTVRGDKPIRGRELIIERLDGSRSHVMVFPDPTHDCSGILTGAVNMLVDITGIKVVENALRTSERTLRTLTRAMEQSPTTVVITNSSGEIEYVNPKFTELTGYSSEEALGKNPRLLKSGRQSPGFYEELWETITAGHDWRGEFCNRKKNGELYWELAVIAPVKDEHGVITHFVALKEDITERKRLEQEVLEISEHEMRRIGQELHDDICQRLAGTVLLAGALAKNLAKESAGSAAQAREIAEFTKHSLDALRLLARGLTPAVIESDGLVGALRTLAENIETIFRIRCRCDCTCTVKIRDQNAALHLYRIAQEAITNAVRHGGAKEVAILLGHHKDRVSMLIRDDGCGIPQPMPLTPGMGLRTMHYRAGSIGATLDIRPGTPGGTEVVCTFPSEL